MAPNLASICAQFAIDGRFVDGRPYGSGHINDTFAVTVEQPRGPRRYILQRINQRVFRDVPALMDNVARVCAHTARRRTDPRRQTLELVPTRAGGSFYRDEAGGFWRAYLFVEHSVSFDIVDRPERAYEAALAFGEFQQQLVDLPGPRLHETIAGFHDTRRRFAAFRQACAADTAGRVAAAGPEIAFAREHEALAGVLLDLHARGEIPERITHNDTKLNNVLFDERTGAALCVIDLDTVMPGLALYDFGDLVRSASNAAAEDETDLARVRMQLPVFEALVRGYVAGTAGALNAAERAHLPVAARLITFEIGLRFLTDFLQGDIYFKVRRPGHNLDRARNQFALVRSMEAQTDAMAAVVARHGG
jgi:hypothetical protein